MAVRHDSAHAEPRSVEQSPSLLIAGLTRKHMLLQWRIVYQHQNLDPLGNDVCFIVARFACGWMTQRHEILRGTHVDNPVQRTLKPLAMM